MKTRRFGRTELDMPVFSCGGMRYQHAWRDEPADAIPRKEQENLEAVIRRALELGINHLETARGYGTSEMQLGWILPSLPRESLIVQTKVSPTANPSEFLAHFERSLRYLKLEYVDLLSFHGINVPEILEWTLCKGGCLEVARQLQAEGRVRHVGFSTHGPTSVIVEAIKTGEFDYVNLHWYFVNDLNRRVLAEAQRQDMGVFIISPTDKGGMLFKPPEKLSRLCAPLTPIQFNDLYCLSRPEVNTLSIGAANPGDFDEHVRALVYYDKLEDTIAPVLSRILAEMREVLGFSWDEEWFAGIPESSEIPGQVNVREIVRLWALNQALDLTDFCKSRYNLLGNADHWAPGNTAESFDEAAILRCTQASPLQARIPEILREAHRMLGATPQKRLSEQEP